MTKLEKVIEGLDAIWCICKNRQNYKKYDEIEQEMYADMTTFIDNAIALLIEQEAIIEQYRMANEFLAAHDWKCKDSEEG